MSEIITVGLDLAKNVFRVHGADGAGQAVLRKKLRRDQVLAVFGQMPPCVVAMEACGGAHFWGREIGNLGHEVRLIPPAYVKPFVKRQKIDAACSKALCCTLVLPVPSHDCCAKLLLALFRSDALATYSGLRPPRPETGRRRPGPSGPRRSVPSCSPAPPAPTLVVCVSASRPAMCPTGRRHGHAA